MKKEQYNNINKNFSIIDLRDKKEYLNEHFSNSINIPYDMLMTNYKNILIKNKTYYIICNKGKLSKRAASMLNYLGYNIIVIEKKV